MKFLKPDIFDDFKCIADKCSESCCIGWEIDIDDETLEYYRTVKGEVGQKLSDVIYTTDEGEYSFRLADHDRCPFLDLSNLCELCLKLGEDSLSTVCTEFPRITLELPDTTLRCLSISCEEVGRMIFTQDEPLGFTLTEQENETENTEECGSTEDADFENFLINTMRSAISILQNRSITIEERMKQYLLYLQNVQDEINESDSDVLHENLPAVLESVGNFSSSDFSSALERFAPYDDMEVLNEEWEDQRTLFHTHFDEQSYAEILNNYIHSSCYDPIGYEHLLVYFTFRYLMNAFFDENILLYGKLAVHMTLTIRDLDALRYKENGHTFTRCDRIDIARIFSKEVEHSDENIELLKEEMLFI